MEVRGNIAGATIEIIVNGNAVGSHVSTVSDSAYPVGVALQANQTVTARQTFNGDSSPASLPVVVQGVPSQLSALTLQTHLHGCGRAVWATGALPGANVQALVGNQAAGSAISANGNVDIVYDPTVFVGQSLTLRQDACNGVTASQVTPPATAAPVPLLPPQIQQPLIECQNSLSLAGVVDGAYVEVYRNNSATPEETVPYALSQGPIWINPLVINDVIRVRQGFSCKEPGPPLETASGFASAVVQSVGKLNAPTFLATACPGTTHVALGNLIPGVRVVISENGQQLGETDAPDVTYTFTTPPLSAGATLEAHMELCGGKKGPSAKSKVASQPQSPDSLQVSDLYACAAYVYVEVQSIPGNFLVFMTNQNGQHISGYYNMIGKGQIAALIPVSPALIAGEQVTVNLQGCGGNWMKYGPFPVYPGPVPQPSFVQPVDAGYNYCFVDSKAAGALIDVYTAGNQWLGSAISVGNLEATPVPLSATLQVGQQLSCTQTMCGQHGDPTPPVTVTKRYPVAPILLQPPNGAHNVGLQPTFVWKDPAAGTPQSADSFHIQAMPGSVVSQTVTTTSYTPPPLNEATTYQWQVTAVNSGGQATSNTFDFQTKLPPIGDLHLVPPVASVPPGFPRGVEMDMFIEVLNSGSATSPPFAVDWYVLDHTNSFTAPHILDYVHIPSPSGLPAGQGDYAHRTGGLDTVGTLFVWVKLLVNNQVIDSTYVVV
ncbi:hypothetical protein [Mycolicibacterium sp. HS_4_1]